MIGENSMSDEDDDQTVSRFENGDRRGYDQGLPRSAGSAAEVDVSSGTPSFIFKRYL